MSAKRKFHLIVGLLSFLSFFVPLESAGTTQLAAEFFLITGTLMSVFTFGPSAVETIKIFIEKPNRIADPGLLIGAVSSYILIAESILYFCAVLVLLLWSLFFPVIESRIGRLLYRVWLLFSVASSIHLSLTYAPSGSGGLGFWLNPVLLLVAAIGEFLIWIWDRQLNRT